MTYLWQGIDTITINPKNDDLLIGSGEGELAILCSENLTTKCVSKVSPRLLTSGPPLLA